MTLNSVDRLDVSAADKLLACMLEPDSPPFALLRRAGAPGGEVEVCTGEISELSSIAELPLPQPGADLLVVVPYRQLAERGYACHDDGAPILVLTPTYRATLDRTDALRLLPAAEPIVSAHGFDLDDQEYERTVRRIIDEEIRTGEGSNFVIRRTFTATLPHYRPALALAIFRRLLTAEPNAYWTFVVHTGDRTFIGASPEQHVRVAGGRAWMNPISGTYRYPPAGPNPADVLDFLADQKEIDELYMVVDEELKMLAGVCPTGARVHGPYLRELAWLAHTEYVLEGPCGQDARDVLRATMFAPTVVGSPLQNASRVIARHERTGRGYYGGVVALLGADQEGRATMDSAIMIRTAEVRDNGTLQVAVGATLVRDSQPAAEVAETWAKVDALLAVLGIDRGNGAARTTVHGTPTAPLSGRSEVRAALAARNAELSSFWLAGAEPSVAAPAVGRALIVDAEDLFTGMLGHQLRWLGLDVLIRSVAEVRLADLAEFDLVVLGPGPGDPRSATDPRIASLRAITEHLLARRIPFIAECLSHQVLCAALGLGVHKRDRPNQGTRHRIDLFDTPALVGFYNSYAARHDSDRLGTPVAGDVAVCRDRRTGEVHAVRGDRFAATQFHLESVLTQRGTEILAELVAWVVRETAPVAGGVG